MSNIFKTAEIVDIGIEKEIKRRDFYALAAESFKENNELKKLFEQLRDWEVTHIEKFTQIRNSVQDYETAESFPGELKEYIYSLVNNSLYSQITPELFPKLVKTPLDAVHYGIEFEKDAILFFSELLPHMQKSYSNSVIQLIQEEKQHILYLTQLKTKLTK